MLSIVLLVFMGMEASQSAPLPQFLQNSPIKHIFPGLQSINQPVQPVSQTPAQLLQPQSLSMYQDLPALTQLQSSSMYQGLPALTQPQSLSMYQGLPVLNQPQSSSIYQGLPALNQPLPPYIQAMLVNNPGLLMYPQYNYENYDLKQQSGLLPFLPIHINVPDVFTAILKFIQSIFGAKIPFIGGLTIQSTNPPIPPGTDINQESLTALGGGPLQKNAGINTQYVPFPLVVLVPQPMQMTQNNGYESIDTKSDL